MKKKADGVNIDLTNNFFNLSVIFAAVLFVLASVFAFGTSNPSVFGHSAKELDFSQGVDGNAVFLGNVGIGVSNPTARLDVGGEVKFGNSGLSCNSARDGSLRFNLNSRAIEFCNGTIFKALGGCSAGNTNFTTPGYYEIEVKNTCSYNFTVSGAGGGRSNGGKGGSVTVTSYSPPSDGTLYILVGGAGGVPIGGFGGGGRGGTGNGGGGGGGASAVRFNNILLVISGGGGGGGPNVGGACGGYVGGTGTGAAGGGGNNCGLSAGAFTGGHGQGGCNNTGGHYAGGSNGNFDPNFILSSGGNGISVCTGADGGGGAGYGGGGGAFSYEGRGGGGGGGFLNTSEISSFTVGTGPTAQMNGSVALTWN